MEVSEVDYKEISTEKIPLSSEQMRDQVQNARDIQKERFKDKAYSFNSQIPDKDLKKYCKLDEQSKKLMEIAFNKYNMSARTYNKILKISRTIADMDNSAQIKEDHLLESIQYRSIDSKFWGN